MKHFSQIVHTWMYGNMPLIDICDSLARAGADGLDLSISKYGKASVDVLLNTDIKSIAKERNLKVLAASMLAFEPETDLSSDIEAVRMEAIEFAKGCVDVTAHAGCDKLLVSASQVSVTAKVHTTYEEDWDRAVKSIAEVAQYAKKKDVTLMIEPINRYRVTLVHTVDEALKMMADVNQPNVGIVPDIFHMRIEETEPIECILKKAGKAMKCLHLGDGGRTVPGVGSINWNSILLTLDAMGYDGSLSYEPVMLYFDEAKMHKDAKYAEQFEGLISSGIKYINKLIAK